MNKDLEAFIGHMSWLFHPSTISDVTETEIELSEKFTVTFPILTALINQARVLSIKIKQQPYYLFSWTNKDNQNFGWLNKIENNIPIPLPFIEEHQLLLKEIGGIQESFNQPDPSFSNNQEFMFVGSECTTGINDWNDYYEGICNKEEKPQIDYRNFISFVMEANGNSTVYDPKTKEVFLFAHDHAFNNVDLVENQPEYTFYRFRNIISFADYVEALALEWKNELA